MSKTYIPQGYSTKLSLYETQKAISLIKASFEKRLRKALQLQRVSAPLFVTSNSGLNDNLNGIERPVSFDIPEIGGDAQVVHSLAKWKRLALYRYGFEPDTGLYTDMNAIRRDEELDNLHSIYVDQWDWEKVITAENRNLSTLQDTVKAIVNCICDTLERVKEDYPYLPVKLKREISFVTSQELEDMYPQMSGKERENAYLKQHKTACIMQIGGLLKSGQRHDGRAPDYDDWDLNCDILFWHPILECAFEISSMGIRVSAQSLAAQLKAAGCEERAQLPFHKMVMDGTLPYTMGGGIGQSRLCMLLLGKAHIGEVQVSLWDADTQDCCTKAGVNLL